MNATEVLDLVSASQEYLVTSVDAVFLLLCSTLVFFMKAGFLLLEVGSASGKRNPIHLILKNVMDVCVGIIMYFAFGYAFSFGSAGTPFIGSGNFFFSEVPAEQYPFAFFQFGFAGTAATVMSGALCGRIKLTGYMMFVVLTIGFSYPVVAHWVWASNGWLSATNPDALFGMGLLDFAGSGVVHLFAGTAAFVAINIVGFRQELQDEDGEVIFRARFEQDSLGWVSNPIVGFSPVYVALGALMLVYGWFGFNAGSAISVTSSVSSTGRALLNTMISAGSASISAVSIGLVMNRRKSHTWDVEDCLNGMLSGCVAVCASCSMIEPWAAMIVGLGGGAAYKLGASLLSVPRLRFDDPVGASAVHGVVGLYGVLMGGFFPVPEHVLEAGYSAAVGGAFYGGGLRLAASLVGAAAIMAWSALWAIVCFGFMHIVDVNRDADQKIFFIDNKQTHSDIAWGNFKETGQGWAAFQVKQEGSPAEHSEHQYISEASPTEVELALLQQSASRHSASQENTAPEAPPAPELAPQAEEFYDDSSLDFEQYD